MLFALVTTSALALGLLRGLISLPEPYSEFCFLGILGLLTFWAGVAGIAIGSLDAQFVLKSK
jgi:hypothetical protein